MRLAVFALTVSLFASVAPLTAATNHAHTVKVKKNKVNGRKAPKRKVKNHHAN
jgi:hypothetical protein